jgi:hypothetical protein
MHNLPIAPLPANVNITIEELESLGATVVPLQEAEVVPTIAQLAASPSSQVLREYIVSVHNFEDIDSLYEDMESPGGSLYIPNRRVEVAARRPISRNTHYWLTDIEALMLQSDPRVCYVGLTPEERQIVKHAFGSVSYQQQSSNFSKAGSNDVSFRNWALLRNTRGSHIPGWGSETGQTPQQTGNITRYDTGKHVDVVICDAQFDPSHPEYQWNSDGTGGTRVVQYNWYQLDPIVKGTTAGTSYVYNTTYGAHGTHVAGIACGNRHGWAREANIYNFDPLGTNPNGTTATSYIFDYLQAFHKNKTINPATGRRNPTVANHSWGYSTYLMDVNYIDSINRLGSVAAAPNANTLTYLVFYGEQVGFTSAYANGLAFTCWQSATRDTSTDISINDCTANGVINVCSAGNSYGMQDVPGGTYYNNYIRMNASAPNRGTEFGGANTTFYTRRGTSPAAAENVICVGNLGTQQTVDNGSGVQIWANGASYVGTKEVKSASSETGPRVDIWAPGENIMSAAPGGAGVADDRNGSFGMQIMTGTSMAAPQITGYVACIASQYPNMTPAEMKAFIKTQASDTPLGNTNMWGGTPWGNPTGYPFDWLTDVRGGTNKVFYLQDIKPDEGVAKPLIKYKTRPASGAVYPRPNRTHRVT